MIHLIEEKLKLGNYNSNTPMYDDYASSIYSDIIKSSFQEFNNILPSNYYDFKIDITTVFSNLKSQDVKTNVEISTPINNLSSIMELTDDIRLLFNNNPEHFLTFMKIFLLQKIHLLTVISLQSKKLTYTKTDVLNFLENKIQFSQTAIANEWDIDNDTLSKWFLAFYGENVFEGRKRINLSEYLKIFSDFFLIENDEKRETLEYMIPEDQLDFYNSVAIKGKTYSKKDIIEECFNPDENPSPRQYAEAKKILSSKFNYYSELNKFPPSIAFKLIDELKKYI